MDLARLVEGFRQPAVLYALSATEFPRVVAVNDAARELAGFGPEMVGARVDELYSPTDLRRHERWWGEVIRDGGGVEYVEALETPRGTIHLDTQLIAIGSPPAYLLTVVHDVTAREAALEHVRLGERRLAVLTDRIADAIAFIDGDGIIQYATPSFERILGYRPEDLSSTRAFDLVADEDRGAMRAFARAVGEGREPGPIRYRARTADGSYRWLEASALNLMTDPAFGTTVVTFRDITEQQTTDTALRRSQEMLARAQSIAHLGSFEWRPATNEVSWSDEVYRILGLDPESGASSLATILERIHPDDREAVVDAVRRTLEGSAGGDTYDIEHRVIRPTGEVRHVRDRAEVTRSSDGVAVHVIGTLLDVTDRVQADAQRARLDARYRALISNLSDAILVIDGTGMVMWASTSYERVTGHRPGDVVGRPSWEFVHPDDLPAARSLIEPAGDGTGSITRLELRYRHRSGSWVWVEAAASPLVDDELVDGVVITFHDVTHQHEARAALAYRALHDVVTGLPNRALLTEQLSRALSRATRTKHHVGVVFCDLDRFKLVNDTRGHGIGDRLLVDVGKRLTTVIRSSDVLARFGGDEFVILCEDLDESRDLLTVARRVEDCFHEPFLIDGDELFVTVSIGIAIAESGQADADALLREADTAMYRAKEEGRGRIAAYDESLRERAQRRLDTEVSLRRAIGRDQIRVHYQPMVRLDDGRIVGMEALVRWAHPERGLLLPGEFIDVAEESGLIVPLGAEVLEHACRHGARTAPITMSVNMSSRQLTQPDVVGLVERLLEATGLTPGRLSLELTESVLIDDSTSVLARLRALKALGVRLFVDDFGTGYSSLVYLKRYPIDGVKIDRAFVAGLGRDPEDAAICAAVLAMGRALGLTVIAEGIETQEQRRHLIDLGCELGQGYLFGRPTPELGLIPG